MDGAIFLSIFIILTNFICRIRGQADFIPEIYTLTINTEFRHTPRYYVGNVDITVKCVNPTKQITLDASDLAINNHEVTVTRFHGESLTVRNVLLRKKNELLIIKVEQYLIPEEQYQVYISFEKNLPEEFQAIEVPSFSKMMRKFDITNNGNSMRSVFPCFDLVDNLAKFKISIGYQYGVYSRTGIIKTRYTTSSNMLRSETVTMPPNDSRMLDEYPLSPPMYLNNIILDLITYLLPEKNYDYSASNILFRIWIREVDPSRLQFAFIAAARCIDFYSEYFDWIYELTLLEIVAYEHFDDQDTSVQNYGLIMLNEISVLYINGVDDTSRSDIALKFCYITSHQWIRPFGTTLSIFTEDWVTQGLLILLEARCIQEILSEDNIDYMNVIYTQRFMTEMNRGTREAYIASGSNSLSREKAFCLLRMMEFLLGKGPFEEGIRLFVRRYRIGKADSFSVWNSILEIVTKYKGFFNEESFEIFMKSWSFNGASYPIVTITRITNSNTVLVQQVPYKKSTAAESSTSSEECFLIPLTYRTKGSPEAVFYTENILAYDILEITIDNLGAEEWVLFNLNTFVLSATNYDMENWKLIQTTLLDEDEFTEIDEMTRVRLVHDLFYLSRAGILKYDLVFETLQYLKHEKSHSVWTVVQEELHKIRSNLLQTELLLYSFETYIREILIAVFNQRHYSAADLPNENAKYSLIKIIMDLSCTFEVETCENLCSQVIQDVLESYVPTKLHDIPVAVRDLVLCHGIKNEEQEKWLKLYPYYHLFDMFPLMQKDTLMAMGCSKKKEILKLYISWCIDREMIYPQDSVIIFRSFATNELGYNFMKEWLFTSFPKIQYINAKYHAPGINEYLAVLLDATTTSESLTEIINFMNVQFPTLALEEQLKENIAQANMNVQWIIHNSSELNQFFGEYFLRYS